MKPNMYDSLKAKFLSADPSAEIELTPDEIIFILGGNNMVILRDAIAEFRAKVAAIKQRDERIGRTTAQDRVGDVPFPAGSLWPGTVSAASAEFGDLRVTQEPQQEDTAQAKGIDPDRAAVNAFEEAARPLMRYLANNHCPHAKVIVDATSAELLQGSMGVNTLEYLKD